MTVSAAVINYNGAAYLKGCLEALVGFGGAHPNAGSFRCYPYRREMMRRVRLVCARPEPP